MGLFNSFLISPLSIAPMIDWTYTHFRVFMRLLAPQALLYTEMETTNAILHNTERALFYQPLEHPLALQLGGANPVDLVKCARMAEEKGFAEVNINLGCPSDKVQAGRFGACLMREGEHVAHCIRTLKEAVAIPITAKLRIGIDNCDSYAFFAAFARDLIDAGANKLIIHARKAWLQGLNPKQNRTIPPINYDFVYRLKEEFSLLPIVVNGDIKTLEAIKRHMEQVDGVMLGRLAYQNPYAIALIHHWFYPQIPLVSRHEIVQNYLAYTKFQWEKGAPLSFLLKPIYNLAHGLPEAKKWKSILMQSQQEKNVSHFEKAIQLLAKIELN